MPRIDILFSVDDDVISRLDKKRPKSGDREYYYAKFSINGEIWDNIDNKRASFTRGNNTYIMPLEAYNDCLECKIPWEVMTKPGYFNVGIFGGNRLLTNQVKVDVDKGCLYNGTESVPPTPDWFNKIDMKIDDIDSKIENIETPDIPTKLPNPQSLTFTGAVNASYDGSTEVNVKIPDALSDLSEDATHRVVTDAEKAKWNAKSNFSGSYNDLTDKPTIPDVPVKSVNGKTGAVVLSAEDVGALPGSTVIPEALPNPNAITFTGAAEGTYDGSNPLTVEIPVGADGKSAYQYAVEGGYAGTEAEFSKKLASDALIVTITESNGTLSADKSYLEIWDAIIAGIPVFVGYNDVICSLIQTSSNNNLYFSATLCDNDVAGSVVVTIMIEITPNGEVHDFSEYVEALPNPNALTFTGAVTGSYDGSVPLTVEIPRGDSIVPAPSSADNGKYLGCKNGAATWMPVEASGGGDISLGLTTASVGQTIKVKAVDENGKPTEWEAVDMPSGGGHWETVLDTVWEQDVINPTAFDSETGIFTCASGELDNLALGTEYVFFQQCVKENVAYNTILGSENLKVTKLSETTFSIDVTPPTTFVPTNVKFSRGACLVITDIDAKKIRLTLDGQFRPTATLYDKPFFGMNVPYFGRNIGYQQIRNAYHAYQQVTAEVESPYRIVGEILCGFNAPSNTASFHFKNNSFCCPLVPTEFSEGDSKFSSDGTKIAKLYSTSTPWHLGSSAEDAAIVNDYLRIISGTKVKLERWVE